MKPSGPYRDGSDYDSMSLTELITLQDELNRLIRARFEQKLALLFSDVVGSTQYFERHGNALGLALQKRHVDLLEVAVGEYRGRVVDRAGDGVFCVLPSPNAAANAAISFLGKVVEWNEEAADEHQLHVRIGVHFGAVLTDEVIVTGEAVNLAARISSSAEADEIRFSQDVVNGLTPSLRKPCHAFSPLGFKGIPEPVEVAIFEWRDEDDFPKSIRIEETGEFVELPDREVIRFGRLALHNDLPANDVVLSHSDPALMTRISRWHFELRRKAYGFDLYPLSKAPTEVDGVSVAMGTKARIRPGSLIKVSGILTLSVFGDEDAETSETVYT